jgi:hypothetical protein
LALPYCRMSKYADERKRLNTSRHDVLSIVDDFIEQIFQIRKILRGVSISAMILGPLAIALSVYLVWNPSFFAILEIENEFGLVLSILLGAVIIISLIWLITGIRQYHLIGSWNKRYNEYIKEKQEIDKTIASQYGLDNSLDNNYHQD